ncbi:hypothetical protein C8A00DRAFT_15333 [Chaetomidium leptoderma]|uniref:Meiotically up-regulated gene 190 protein n=1 Tax=Chaetomidium leptoderma TaxID=669021 RepID=A0AAN6VNG6_9PEZI|nr:hypothetical protein C8A00DRAFT_15333 [Chaetomidium leptoderma]
MDDFEDRGPRKAHGGPYTAKHPIPTVQGYRHHREEIKEQNQADSNQAYQGEEEQGGESKRRRAYESIKKIAKDEDKQPSQHEPYPTANRNASGTPAEPPQDANQSQQDDGQDDQQQQHSKQGKRQTQEKHEKSATETVAQSIDPKEKRKTMKKAKRSGGGREVTDPVTHLPVVVHDMTDRELKSSPENLPGLGEDHRTLTGVSCADKSQDHLDDEKRELDRGFNGMQQLFPPPDFEDTKREMMRTYRNALLAGLGAISALFALALAVVLMLGSSGGGYRSRAGKGWSFPWSTLSIGIILPATGAAGFLLIQGISGWLSRKVDDIFEEEIWDAARQQELKRTESEVELPESVAWLNSLLASVWRLINPDLFSALLDTLEDVMQASLPKVVRMVSVDDMGQGSEAFRILGIRWLPTAAAGQSVDAQGKLKKTKDNDRTVAGQNQDGNADSGKQDGQDEQGGQAIREGMEAEEGDFVNMELAFAYRARSSGKSIMSKAKNAHLYLKFYLPGGIAVPVWVELRGLVGTMRLRLQLTPDPPFFQLCTLTFLGQPKADLSCVPLSKHSLNLMDVPLISSFVQSSIDAALAEYVAPKSLTLDIKDMLMGDDFKKDTLSRGIVLVHIKKARGFKEGDGGFGPFSGSSDSYVSVSWGKFGKPVASTRIIIEDSKPNWNEWAWILVSPDEINAQETLRLHLWDSDKHTADDDLGRVELSLKELMHGSTTKNKMCDREDPLHAEDPDEKMPGTLTWSVGFFSKAHIQQCQLDKQTFDPSIRSVDQLKDRVSKDARNKLREALAAKDMEDELRQQERQDCKELEDALIISAPPPHDLPSGILSIQIHNITGLEVSRLNRDRKSGAGDGEGREDEAEQSDDLPDSYCAIILNHRKIYRTRTKPKNAKPFFNAGTERFVKDWATTEVIVSVRDAREGENDPLLGIVYLPLRRVLEHRSQVMGTYPLAGGMGYGRARISMVWRSVEVKMPRALTGWDYGTLEVRAPVKAVEGKQLPMGILQCKLKLKTKIGKAKMKACESGGGEEGGREGMWGPKREVDGDSVFLGVIKRYTTSLIVEFKNSSFGAEDNPALAVLWLGDVPDEEDHTVRLKVWKGGKKQLGRARSCADYHGIEEGEQPLGEIELQLRFWRGLSGYHKAYAHKAKNRDVKAVMEVLDTVNDEKMTEGEAHGHGEGSSLGSWESSSSSSEGSDDEDTEDGESVVGGAGRQDSRQEANTRKMLRKAGDSSSSEEETDQGSGGGPIKPIRKLPAKLKSKTESILEGKGGSDDDGKRGPMSQVQDYKRHHKQLHRKHRGIMQWKATRTMDWMVDKVKGGKGKIEEVVHHGDKEQGIETEV